MKAIIIFKKSLIAFSLCGLFLPPGQATAATVFTGAGQTNTISEVDDLDPARTSFTLTQNSRLLTLNFRGAPLKEVLGYLSEAAGFIVLPETEIKGTVDVWSDYPRPFWIPCCDVMDTPPSGKAGASRLSPWTRRREGPFPRKPEAIPILSRRTSKWSPTFFR
jgi:hypothetical protein